MMNIGVILPDETRKKGYGLFRIFSSFGSCGLKAYKIEIVEGLYLLVCLIPVKSIGSIHFDGFRKRMISRIDKLFQEEKAWPYLVHPMLSGFKQPLENEKLVVGACKEVILNRFTEVLKLLSGIGNPLNWEVTITGGSNYLEYAILRLLKKVKTINLLIPEGASEPKEADKAFEETGIPIHITDDHDVLARSRVWIRFPKDHQSFDILPQTYKGIIVDLDEMKIIDTKIRKIFNITLEFSDRIKRRIGHNITKTWGKGVLEGVILMVCANAWETSITDTSNRLEMRISFNS